MTTLELEADKARLAYAILSIDNASLLAEVKKKLGDLLTINGPAVKSKPRHTRPISKEVQDMVIGELSADMDIEVRSWNPEIKELSYDVIIKEWKSENTIF